MSCGAELNGEASMTQHGSVAPRGHLDDDSGFTLIEILIAIVLVGILSAVAVIGVGNLTSKAKASVCSAERDTLTTAAKIYLTENQATDIPSDAKAGVTPMDTLREA